LHVLAGTRAVYACNRWAPGSRLGGLLKRRLRVGLMLSTRLCNIVARSEINVVNLRPEIEGGVYLSGRGHIIIGVRSIGAGTVIHDHVTLGRSVKSDDVPEIGRRVWIGPRSVIYGKIKLGDGVTVLPDTVLSRSIPAGSVVRGNPATIVRRDYDNAAFLASGDPHPEALLEEFSRRAS
jgi:serine acetyltransferase